MSDAEIQADFERIKANQPDPISPTEPSFGQVRGSDGQIYDINTSMNPNGWKNPNNPNEGLIDRNNPSTWSPSALWDDSLQDWERSQLPSGHPQHENNRPDWDKGGGNLTGGAGDKKEEEIFNWTEIAGLPTYTTIADWQWTDNGYESVNRPVMLESESSKSGDTWEYKYRYLDRDTGEVVEDWNYWTPGP